jgi:two-component system, LuxR family, response regulator FixJ
MTRSLVVHVIDDDDAARDSLAFLLSASSFSVRSYASAAAFLDSLPASAGCVITDLRMPEIDGLELLRRLASLDATMPVIVVTGHGDVPLALEALRAGAVDFIEKPFDDETIVASVRFALGDEGGRARQVDEIQRKLESLTVAERRVLDGLTSGISNKAIASQLHINVQTVEIHRAGIMTKMQARSVSHLIRMASWASRSGS